MRCINTEHANCETLICSCGQIREIVIIRENSARCPMYDICAGHGEGSCKKPVMKYHDTFCSLKAPKKSSIDDIDETETFDLTTADDF